MTYKFTKYKFTKTIKPTEGICIYANGTVTNLPTSSAPMSKRTVVVARVEKPSATMASASMRGRTRKHDKWARHKGFAQPHSRSVVVESKPRNKPVVVVPLSSVNNPYYGERALHDVPPARPCGMFGLSRPRPITRTAAMSFQNRGA